MTQRWSGRIIGTLVASLLPALVVAQQQPASEAFSRPVPERPGEMIEVAIALDTSASMQGLIDAARLKLWDVVHELATAEPTPRLRVALLTYSARPGLPRDQWVRVETDLTDDLDLVSERLFGVVTGAGNENVGRALEVAMDRLEWSRSEEVLKLIFVLGNEEADRVPAKNLTRASAEAVRSGILVSAIYLGEAHDVAADSWREVADRAQGLFAVIDRRAVGVVFETPFDSELAELGQAVNQTYLPMGARGQERQKRRVAQDKKARRLSAATAASRAQVKTSSLYSSGWDLVDAVEAQRVDLYELDETELPAQLRALGWQERELYLEEMRQLRSELRQRIGELGEQRRRHIAGQVEARGLDGERSFDAVVRQVIRERAEEHGFRFPAL